MDLGFHLTVSIDPHQGRRETATPINGYIGQSPCVGNADASGAVALHGDAFDQRNGVAGDFELVRVERYRAQRAVFGRVDEMSRRDIPGARTRQPQQHHFPSLECERGQLAGHHIAATGCKKHGLVVGDGRGPAMGRVSTTRIRGG